MTTNNTNSNRFIKFIPQILICSFASRTHSFHTVEHSCIVCNNFRGCFFIQTLWANASDVAWNFVWLTRAKTMERVRVCFRQNVWFYVCYIVIIRFLCAFFQRFMCLPFCYCCVSLLFSTVSRVRRRGDLLWWWSATMCFTHSDTFYSAIFWLPYSKSTYRSLAPSYSGEMSQSWLRHFVLLR